MRAVIIGGSGTSLWHRSTWGCHRVHAGVRVSGAGAEKCRNFGEMGADPADGAGCHVTGPLPPSAAQTWPARCAPHGQSLQLPHPSEPERGVRFFCHTHPGSSWLPGRRRLCPVHPVCMGKVSACATCSSTLPFS